MATRCRTEVNSRSHSFNDWNSQLIEVAAETQISIVDARRIWMLISKGLELTPEKLRATDDLFGNLLPLYSHPDFSPYQAFGIPSSSERAKSLFAEKRLEGGLTISRLIQLLAELNGSGVLVYHTEP